MIIEQNGFIHHVFFWLKNADNKEDIYDRDLRVYVKQFMRKELKLNNLDELKEQIAIDEVNAKKILGMGDVYGFI